MKQFLKDGLRQGELLGIKLNGRPVCTEMWPGDTADNGSLVLVIDRLRKR